MKMMTCTTSSIVYLHLPSIIWKPTLNFSLKIKIKVGEENQFPIFILSMIFKMNILKQKSKLCIYRSKENHLDIYIKKPICALHGFSLVPWKPSRIYRPKENNVRWFPLFKPISNLWQVKACTIWLISDKTESLMILREFGIQMVKILRMYQFDQLHSFGYPVSLHQYSK